MSDIVTDSKLNDAESERLLHYNGGVELFFSPAYHAYYVYEDGVKVFVPGVTSILDMIDKSGALTQWAANMTVECLRQKLTTLVGDIVSKTDLASWFEEARFNFRKIKQEAADIGKEAHEWLDNFSKDLIKSGVPMQEFSNYSPIPEEPRVANCINAALGWMLKHNFTPIEAEKKLFSRKYCYAGTTDWIAYITSCGDPKCCPFEGTMLQLGDYKSSKSIYDTYAVQAVAYKYAYEEEFPDKKIEGCTILRLGKDDGEFDTATFVDGFESHFNCFLGTTEMYNWRKQGELDKKAEKLKEKELKPKKTARTPRRAVLKETHAITVEV